MDAPPRGGSVFYRSADGRYLGAIVLDALKGHLPDWSHLPMVVAADVLDPGVTPVHPDLPLSHLRSRFADTHLDRLPVVEPSSAKLVGAVSKRRLLGAE